MKKLSVRPLMGVVILGVALALPVTATGATPLHAANTIPDTEPAIHLGAADVYARRLELLYADERCPLLSVSARGALQASILQLRGTLLRAGARDDALDEANGVIRMEAENRSCDDHQLQQEARQVEELFVHYLRLRSMTFPAFHTGWEADRAERSANFGWPLKLDRGSGGDAGRIGILASRASTSFSVRIPDNVGPVLSVRLLVPKPDNDLLHRSAHDVEPLARPWPLMEAEARTFFAGEVIEEETPDRLRHRVFQFPDRALAALSGADPRASFAVLIDERRPDGTLVTQQLSLPVGDFYSAAHFAIAEPGQAVG